MLKFKTGKPIEEGWYYLKLIKPSDLGQEYVLDRAFDIDGKFIWAGCEDEWIAGWTKVPTGEVFND